MSRALIMLATLLLLPNGSAVQGAAGSWEFSITVLNDTVYQAYSLKVDGGKVAGNAQGGSISGTVKGPAIEFRFVYPDGWEYPRFQGRVDGDSMTGTGLWEDGVTMTWSARRATMPNRAPKVHDFEPTQFHRVFSDAIPPALRIFPKDTVRTWTVDAGGVDSKGVTRSLGGNPETGPFYVEGAFPGDTLVVKLTKVRLNRTSATSGNRLVSSALTADYLAGAKYRDDFDSDWILDLDKGVARLKKPSDRLKDYTVKLQPMIGCLAVAPRSHQAFRVGWPGDFGGNMDYNQLREGTTVYLPVFVPGALLFIGDGHAAQGDGELTGDALETSMDVEFTVDVIKGQSTGAPRSENDEFLMTSGIANSLGEALQRATTQLANWLQRDYKLDSNEAAVVLGTAIRFDIAEIVDPLVHVVAKIRKDALASIRK